MTDNERAAVLGSVSETGRWHGETVHTRRDGTPIAVEITSMALRDEAGREFGHVAVNRDITQRKRIEQELESNRERLQNLSRRLVELQENERYYVANQLYNDAGQRLSALLLGLGTLQRDKHCNSELAPQVKQMIDLADGVLQDMHSLAVNLRPASLDRLGLAVALHHYVVQFSRQVGMAAQTQLSALDGMRLPAKTETAIFRIVQEALANVALHGRAREVAVTAARRKDRVTVIVEDDGIGFDVDEVERLGGLGLLGMRERAEGAGGRLTVESQPGRGTTVFVDVPCASQ